ncbi:hypothetical protein ACSDR0_48205 [Streptosporangium sp. G11]|uniref:hypothetical protein n=1 Tax=Streptosporangium sp. G11 TaxID=3436926 RepID=UPI003EB83C93
MGASGRERRRAVRIDKNYDFFTANMAELMQDDGVECVQVTADGLVLIDDICYRAGEAYLGGIVVQPTAYYPD